MRCLPLTAIPLLILSTLCPAAPVPQTRPWRIAIAGGQAVAARGGDIPSYLSLLALHGLPRVRIDEAELTDLSRLKQFDVVIACWGAFGNEPAMRTLEQYASEGGIVVSEGWPMPSAQVLPGKRLGPAPNPNVRFVPSDNPISQGLPELGVIKSAVSHREAGSIIPDPGTKAIVLARYTDEDTPDKLKGRFPDGKQGAPAILLIPHGKGWILYSGPSISSNLAGENQPPEHLICRILSFLSKGELSGRLFPGTVDRAELVTMPAPAEEPALYPAPQSAAQSPPQGFEVLEEAAELQDFVLQGKLPANGQARVLVGYWSSRDHTELAFASGKLTVRHTRDGRAAEPQTAALPQGANELTITRRNGLITIVAGDQLVYGGATGGPQQGALAAVGLEEPTYQPLAPTSFADDFMREENIAGEWEAQTGNWEVVASEGKAETGVNPFNYQAKASLEAVSLAGQWFWSDYAYSVSAQGSGQALGLIAHYTDGKDYLLLRLIFATDPRASRLQLVQRRAGSDTILTGATVSAAKTDWHRLELRTGRGRLQGWLNGQLVLEDAGSPAACGRIGLYCQQGNANFDDVVVESWAASPPGGAPRLQETLASGGTWTCDASAGILSGTGTGGARMLLPWPDVADCQADVRVKLGQAEAAGLLLRARDKAYVLVALCRDGNKLRLRAYRQARPGVVLAEAAVDGSPAEWHALHARYSGPRLELSVDGKPVAQVLDGASTGGAVGLYVRGKQAAQFQDLAAWAEPASDRLADEVTPEFAGVIDRNTWAGRSGAWTPDPARLDCLWHAGYFPGPVRLEAGVHRQDAPETTTLLHLSQPGQPERGYTLKARRNWTGKVVDLTLSYRGQTVAHGTAEVPTGAAYALGLERSGPTCW